MRTKKEKKQSLQLKYTGCLDGANSIYLHYGIGENWEDVSECKMRKLKTCYKTEVTIPAGAELKFCFRDTEGNWDNNYGKDYSYNTTTEDTPMNIYSAVEVNPYTPKTLS
ncbi:MAG: hypothetical protein IJ217_03155 [Clostridia bacterium]|nr:hypothetical protein [Clostridia bacterium]